MENLDFIKSEMLTHIPFNTHAEPKRVLVINGAKRVGRELEKYTTIGEVIHIDCVDTVEKLKNLGAKKFDVAIVSTPDYTNSREFWIELTKNLDAKGVVAIEMSNIITKVEDAKKELKIAGKIYPIVMPYRYERAVDGDVVTSEYLMLASRFYHPTADINLQRADLTDSFAYYNSDIAISAFTTPSFVNKEYLEVIKR
jgi:spermidine synthase